MLQTCGFLKIYLYPKIENICQTKDSNCNTDLNHVKLVPLVSQPVICSSVLLNYSHITFQSVSNSNCLSCQNWLHSQLCVHTTKDITVCLAELSNNQQINFNVKGWFLENLPVPYCVLLKTRRFLKATFYYQMSSCLVADENS